jgi:hypothetical protein
MRILILSLLNVRLTYLSFSFLLWRISKRCVHWRRSNKLQYRFCLVQMQYYLTSSLCWSDWPIQISYSMQGLVEFQSSIPNSLIKEQVHSTAWNTIAYSCSLLPIIRVLIGTNKAPIINFEVSHHRAGKMIMLWFFWCYLVYLYESLLASDDLIYWIFSNRS